MTKKLNGILRDPNAVAFSVFRLLLSFCETWIYSARFIANENAQALRHHQPGKSAQTKYLSHPLRFWLFVDFVPFIA